MGTTRQLADKLAKDLKRGGKTKYIAATVGGRRAEHRSLPGVENIPWIVLTTFVRPGGRLEIKGDSVRMAFGGHDVVHEFPKFGDRHEPLDLILRKLKCRQVFGLFYNDVSINSLGDNLDERGITWSLLFAGPDPDTEELADCVLIQAMGQLVLGGNVNLVQEYGVTVSYHSHGHVNMQIFVNDDLFEYAELSAESQRLVFEILTGDDDLRGGNDNLDVILDDRSGGGWGETYYNINRSARWADRTKTTTIVQINNPIHVGDIDTVTLRTTSRGGAGGDNWNMQNLTIKAEGRDLLVPLYSDQGKDGSDSGCLFRFTGQNREFPVKIRR